VDLFRYSTDLGEEAKPVCRVQARLVHVAVCLSRVVLPSFTHRRASAQRHVMVVIFVWQWEWPRSDDRGVGTAFIMNHVQGSVHIEGDWDSPRESTVAAADVATGD
jgi:hypothetical protein